MRDEISLRYAEVDDCFERIVCSCEFGMGLRRIGWVNVLMYVLILEGLSKAGYGA